MSEGDTNLRAADRHTPMSTTNIKVNGNGKVILDTHPESDQHQSWTCSRGSPPAPTHQIWWWSMNPFLRYLADKRVRTDTQTHRHTDRHTPMTTRPCGLRLHYGFLCNTWNGTMFVDLDWPLNASSLLSASAELLVTMRISSTVVYIFFLQIWQTA